MSKNTPAQKVHHATDVFRNAMADAIKAGLMDSDPYYIMLAAMQVALDFVTSTSELGYVKPAELVKLHDAVTLTFEAVLDKAGATVRVGPKLPGEPVLN